MQLKQHYVEKPWGVDRLPPPFARQDGKRIGEIWFESAHEKLDLLVKYIFTSERLSIQVHPDDAYAQAMGLDRGKEECWYVIAAEPEARLAIGTVKPLSAEELRAASLDGSIAELVNWKSVKAGDFYYIPSGTVHAIGAGVGLIEVQQNSDITYRLYDYGRPRELHLDDAVAVSNPQPYDDSLHISVPEKQAISLTKGPYFDFVRILGNEGLPEIPAHKTQLYVIPMEHPVTVSGIPIAAGQCAVCSTLREIDSKDSGLWLLAY